MPEPFVSVVMPVRNAASFVRESVGSILDQTFRAFEFVVVDDASTDATPVILEQLARSDSRIRFIRSEQHRGVVGCANFVIEQARAPLIARMDADDLSHPERLAREFDALSADPEAVGVGALHEGIDSTGSRVRPRDRWRLLVASQSPPFAHGSTMFRRAVFEEVGGYREACVGWEDQDLFLRMAAKGRFVVLPEALYFYRFHRQSTSAQWDFSRRERITAMREACLRALRSGSGYDDLLGHPAPVTDSVSAVAARYEAGMRIWSGDRPVRESARRTRSLAARSWIWLGILHPSAFRLALCGLIRMRDAFASVFIRDGKKYRWHSA